MTWSPKIWLDAGPLVCYRGHMVRKRSSVVGHEFWCRSKRHLWNEFSEDLAERCCNGWTVVYVPDQYEERIHEWAAIGRLSDVDPHSIWQKSIGVAVLIPDRDVDLIDRLRRLEGWMLAPAVA